MGTPGTLTICPTPIGNLDDVTPRQRDALAGADVIACEDTRTTGKLLERLGIARVDGRPRLVSYHEHNARDRAGALVESLQAGESVLLVSDAGTPTISDPGYRLVREAAEAGVVVTALPGPVAAVVAVSASGLPTDRFLFEGFLPAKAAARAARLGVLRTLGVTIVLYESPHRLVRALEDVRDVYGAEHPVCVARELTKVHEEYVRGPAAGVAAEFAGRDKVRGEFVVIVAPVDLVESHMLDDAQLEAKALEMLGRGKRTREVRDALVASTQMTSSELYEFIESLKGK